MYHIPKKLVVYYVLFLNLDNVSDGHDESIIRSKPIDVILDDEYGELGIEIKGKKIINILPKGRLSKTRIFENGDEILKIEEEPISKHLTVNEISKLLKEKGRLTITIRRGRFYSMFDKYKMHMA